MDNFSSGDNKYLSVSAFTDILKTVVEKTFGSVYIKGEISNFRPSSGGIWYFNLKDNEASISCIVFKNNQRDIFNELAKIGKKNLEDGIEILVEGKLNIYKKGGSYSLVVSSVTPLGSGGLFIKFEELKKKLLSEGLFDESHKKPIPEYPARIGIVTSPTGAALQDILNVLKRRFSPVEVIVYPAAVQGDNAKFDIVRAINYADSQFISNGKNRADVLIVARGGGSIEDLWPFNEEIVAHAIYDASIPIISGVGHEIDFTIADMCADYRAPTPSAAAEIVVQNSDELFNRIDSYKLRIQGAFNGKLDLLKSRFIYMKKERLANLFGRIFDDNSNSFDLVRDRFMSGWNSKMDDRRNNFSLITSRLGALNPLDVLKRGYSVVYDSSGKAVVSGNELNSGDEVKIVFKDSERSARIL